MIFLVHPESSNLDRRTLAFKSDGTLLPINKAYEVETGKPCYVQHVTDGDIVTDRIPVEGYPCPIMRCRIFDSSNPRGFKRPQIKEEEVPMFLSNVASIAYAFLKGESDLVLQFARGEE